MGTANPRMSLSGDPVVRSFTSLFFILFLLAHFSNLNPEHYKTRAPKCTYRKTAKFLSVFTLSFVKSYDMIAVHQNMQSRNMRVKCQTDGELPAGRKASPAVHMSHPAASEDPVYGISWCGQRSVKEVFL